MNKILIILLLVFLQILNASNNLMELTPEEKAYLQDKKVLKVHVEKDWEPYNFIQNGQVKGFTNDLIKNLSSYLGIDVEFVKGYPWKQYLSMLENDQIDIISNITKTKQRSKKFSFTEKSILNIKMSILSYDDIQAIKQLENKKVAIVAGYYIETFLKQMYQNITIVTKNNVDELLEGLLNKEYDAVIEDYTVLNNKLNKLGLQENLYNHIILDKNFSKPLYIAVSKDNEILLSLLNKAFKHMEQSEYETLFERWGIYYSNIKASDEVLTPEEKLYLKRNSFNIYTTNWEPFTIHEENAVEGISIDILNQINSKYKINANFITNLPFTEVLEEIKSDKKGIVLATASIESRREYGAFTNPYVSFPISIATNKGEDFIIDFKELEGKTLAVGRNYTSHKVLQRNYPKIKFVPVDNTLEALELLSNRKVYAVADILPVLIYSINKYNYSNLKISGTSKFDFEVRMMLNKQNEKMVQILNKLINSISADYQKKVLNRWIYTREITKVDYSLVYTVLFFSLIIILFLFYRQWILEKNKKDIQNEKDRYKNLMNLSSDMIFIMDLEGNLVDYSKQTQLELGYSDEEMENLTVYDWDKYTNKEHFSEVIENITELPGAIERVHTRKDGSEFYVEIKSVKIDINGKSFIYSTSRNVTEKKQYINKLKDSEFRWKFAVYGSRDGLWDWDLKTNKVFFSKQWKKMLGFKDSDLTNTIEDWKAIIHPDDKQEVLIELDNYLKGKTAFYHKEHRLRCKNGEYIWVLDRGIIVDYKDEKPVRMIGTHSNINDTKALVQQVSILKKQFENMFKTHDSIMLLVEPDTGDIIDANNSAIKFYGYSLEEFKKINISQINTLNKEEIKKQELLAKEGKINYFEFEHKLRDGEKRVVEVHSSPIETENGIILFSIIKDITEIKKHESIIEKQKLEFETIFDYSRDGIAILDLNTNFIKFNYSFLEMTGFTKEELLNKSTLELTAPEDYEKTKEIVEEIVSGNPIDNYEKTYIFNNNRRVTVNISLALLPDKERLLMVVKDVTSLKISQEQIKLASLGEMIGNIAHQWRQPLSIISTCASGLELKSELDILEKDDLKDSMDAIIKQAEYLSNTIENFRNFIKNDKSYNTISIDKTIENTLNIVYASLHNNFITVVKQMDDDMDIYGNTNELTEAFINILNNSKDILKEKIENESDRFIFIKTRKVDEESLEVKFLDSGGGIVAEDLSKVLEPYFTTKHKSQGTGLGLSIADKILRERHNAIIKVYNEEYTYKDKSYKGACFNILFRL